MTDSGHKQRIFSVTELTASIRILLETQYVFISVAGEISNLSKPYSGHQYFTLKDDRAQLKAVLFKMQQRYLAEPLKNGQLVICRGRLSVYEARGDYQLIVDSVIPQGEGALQLAFAQLKKKLAQEGLFEQKKKKSLPLIPEHIVLITSPQGAAVHDFLKVAGQRFTGVNISIYPVSVQGKRAADEIVAAIEEVDRLAMADIIVLCRGGGSIEDLWCFNEEKVARAIDASATIIVSAIGHEIDFTIADFAADLRAPTPSAAAELILPDSKALLSRIDQLNKHILHLVSSMLERYTERLRLYKKMLGDSYKPLENFLLQLDHFNMRLDTAIVNILAAKQSSLSSLAGRVRSKNPSIELTRNNDRLAGLANRLVLAQRHLLETKKNRLAKASGLLDAISPLATLARGYAIARKKPAGEILTDSAQVIPGDKIFIVLKQGGVDCEVDNVLAETTGGDKPR